MGGGAYVVVAGGSAAAGFALARPWPILFAAIITLPSSVAALLAYYLSYGLLAQLPGANPSSSSGSATVLPDGSVIAATSTGDVATWFTVVMPLIGVGVIAAAAAITVSLVHAFVTRQT